MSKAKTFLDDMPSKQVVDLINQKPDTTIVMEDSTRDEFENFERRPEKTIQINEEREVNHLSFKSIKEARDYNLKEIQAQYATFSIPCTRDYFYAGFNKTTKKQYLSLKLETEDLGKFEVRLYEAHVSKFSKVNFADCRSLIFEDNKDTSKVITFNIRKIYTFMVFSQDYNKDDERSFITAGDIKRAFEK